MFLEKGTRNTLNGIKRRIEKASYEDTVLSFLAVIMFNYSKNLIYNWRFENIVRFDMDVLTWAFIFYVGVVIIQGIRNYFKRLGVMKNEEFDLNLDKLRVEVKKLLGECET